MNIVFYADWTVYLIFLHQKPSIGVYFTFTQEIIYASTGIYLHCMAEVEGFSYSSGGYSFCSQSHLGCLGIMQGLSLITQVVSLPIPKSYNFHFLFNYMHVFMFIICQNYVKILICAVPYNE
jgi:hypothetical protein